MNDLNYNEWLLDELDGRNFNGLVNFRASVNRRCEAKNNRLINELQERELELNQANESQNELEKEIEQLKSAQQTNESKMKMNSNITSLSVN